MKLFELTDPEKVPLLLEWLEEAGHRLNRSCCTVGDRYLRIVREMRGEPEYPEEPEEPA